MATDDERTQRISRLYHGDVNVKEALKLMQPHNISSKFVRDIYTQLSKKVEKLMTERFHY
jgi:hypothetical protein